MDENMLEWWFEIGWLYIQMIYKLLSPYMYVHLANLDQNSSSNTQSIN
jgi:hypothetical protein